MSTTSGGDVNEHADKAATLQAWYDAITALAYGIGSEHGTSAASWYFDGNTSREAYETVICGLIDGDPALYDTFPSNPLSGEWADSYSLGDLAQDLGISQDDQAFADACSMYEDGYAVAVADEIERAARAATGIVGDPRGRVNEGRLDPIAYTYDADTHCPTCAARAFGVDSDGWIPVSAIDSENNPVGALAPWDEWYDIGYGTQTLTCGTCGSDIDTYDEDDTDEDEGE
jgi:hypothetical protein